MIYQFMPDTSCLLKSEFDLNDNIKNSKGSKVVRVPEKIRIVKG